MIRPTHKEITSKIKEAKEAAAKRRISSVEPFSFAADAIELDYPVESISEITVSLLNELTPEFYAEGKYRVRS